MRQMIAVSSQAKIEAKSLIQVIVGACLLSLASQVALTLPFSCVPFTLQAQAVLAISCFLGPTRALYSVLLYLTMGVIGLPVFAQGCSSLFHLAGPRGGYLMSYLLVAPVVGHLATKYQGLGRLILTLLLGNSIVFACGFLWLALWIGVKAAFFTGVFPFLISDLAKTLIVATGIESLKRLFFKQVLDN